MRPANPRPDARPSHSPSATAGHWWPAAVGTLSFPEWRLLDAAGQLVPSCAGFSFAERDCGPLTTAGSPYAIEVRDNGLNSTGTYGLHLQRLTAPARCSGDTLANDVPSTGTIEAPVDTNLFSFAASDGERVHVTAAVGTLSFPEWRLLDAAGQPAAGCAAFTFTERDCGPLVAGCSRDVIVPRVAAAGCGRATGAELCGVLIRRARLRSPDYRRESVCDRSPRQRSQQYWNVRPASAASDGARTMQRGHAGERCAVNRND